MNDYLPCTPTRARRLAGINWKRHSKNGQRLSPLNAGWSDKGDHVTAGDSLGLESPWIGNDVRQGLSTWPKTLPPHLFYDEASFSTWAAAAKIVRCMERVMMKPSFLSSMLERIRRWSPARVSASNAAPRTGSYAGRAHASIFP